MRGAIRLLDLIVGVAYSTSMSNTVAVIHWIFDATTSVIHSSINILVGRRAEVKYMNRRATAFALLLLYATIAVVTVALPHHHAHNALTPDANCAACVLHIICATDTPAPVIVVAPARVDLFHPQPTFHFTAFPLFTTADCRAPPHTSA
jgi:hypothetical protein